MTWSRPLVGLPRARAAVRRDPYRFVAAGLALAAGLAVFVLAHELFPYHSANHDEGVYLQQAAMLLEGRLFLTPGSGPLREAFHPWFFVEGERGLYPKYAPVPAAVFAAGKLAGGYRLALGAVAAVNVALTYVLTAAAFDRRTGLLAAATMAGAPLFLVTSAVFLPYAPTTALNLLFAAAYVRAVRRADRRFAALAGVAVGLAFFARPYTAVLFAAPFVIHALWRLSRAGRGDPAAVAPYAIVAGLGSAFVGLALAYNAVVTGSALVFPFEAFAPRDGLGFGRRAILGHELVYTPSLAIEANAAVLRTFAADWFTAGLAGAASAAIGMLAVGRELRRSGLAPSGELSRPQLRLLLLGVVVAVVLGNLLFWGNRNILADLAVADDGLVGLLGPFYHFDLLAPLSAFAAHGAVTLADAFRDRLPASTRAARLGAALLLVVSLPAVAVAEADALGPPVERNAAYTAKYDRAYAPFESTELTDALVFLPPTYGEWRNHPFQWLRNDPGFDGPVVYATARNPADDFAVLDAYPDRTPYRYRYHGAWTPAPTRHVVPVLERLRLVDGSRVTARTAVAVPDRIVGLTVAISNGDTVRRYDYGGDIPETVTLGWTLTGEGASVRHPNLTTSGAGGPVSIDGPGEVVLTVTITEPGGGTLTYREAVQVRPAGDGVEVLWPPASSACPLVTDCGLRGTYLPDRPDTRPTGIALNTTLVEVEP